ncbi:serine-rich adhesin for platelets [Musca domestica]|uniref:Uncharacterized protein LOC101899184 n=2 Tax=Musca domestica TaxID=7370 RepID=A0A1I8NDH5_MUSDO|nr:serine-rich adhesin for platelets [Musca domestica]XP_005184089.1 serine-rich adhesin for platelets [Musca domestica]
MFNFHKPRTYRSTEGCCICRAKSSSSRFTDSRKYERDTMQCFDLKYPRQGEICNACVLLVKRYKRLPVGSKRNWSHVVDARAGPGSSKIQTKYKSDRGTSRSHQSSSNAGNNNSSSNSGASPSNSSCSSSNSSAINGTTSNGHSNNTTLTSASSSSYMPEKYSKIFKKSKKLKDSTYKRKSSSNGWSLSAAGSHSLPTTPDSLDSDYEDSRLHGSLNGSGGGGIGSLGGTVVQFQTQTRASAFRAQVAAEARRRYLKLGSKRRKCLPPLKNRRSIVYESSINFFDEDEWQEKKSCCGMLYECPALGGALIVDVAHYKPCEKHQNLDAKEETKDKTVTKALQHGLPAVVQLQTPNNSVASSSTSSSATCSSLSSTSLLYDRPATTITPVAAASSLTITKSSTPVLKKHHLFFKRQSECFPQGDMVTASETNYYSTKKTESDYNNHTQQQQFAQQQRHNDHGAIHSSHMPLSSTSGSSSSSSLSISVSSIAASSTSSTTAAGSSSSSSSLCLNMPKHSLAKVTTISPTSSLHHHHHHLSTTTTALNNSTTTTKSSSSANAAAHHSFLHKLKTADTGKIVKHSLEKFNTAVRLKISDLSEMKPIIKTVDKSYILAKPSATIANLNSLHNAGVSVTMASSNNGATTTATPYQNLSSYNSMAQPPLTTASMSAASPTSSTSSTSSTKFSDNSSDSGFDENMLLERKSASPLQEDLEKKMLSRHGVQTMFLASGVQIQGQAQNLVLTGNEVAAKILQNRKYTSVTTSGTNARLSSHPTTTAVKIAQISTGNNGSNTTSSLSSSTSVAAAQAKMRAIYNSSNTIQHENGITTIVPASSLAASSQLAAMQNIAQAQAQVTITPAPPSNLSGGGGSSGSQYNAQNIISRKLTAANIINLQSNNLSNTTATIQHGSSSSKSNNSNSTCSSSSSGSNISGNHHLNTTATTATTNQKIILLKTTSSSTSTNHHHHATPPSMMSSSAAINSGAKFNTTTTTTGGQGGGGGGSGNR